MGRVIPWVTEDLAEPMKEIEEIFKKYDIGGFVHLASRKSASFRLFLEPTWSVLEWKDKTKLKVDPEKNITDELDASAHLLFSTSDTCGRIHEGLESVKYQLAEHFEIQHDNPFED